MTGLNISYLLAPIIVASAAIGLIILTLNSGRRDRSLGVFLGLLLSLETWSILTLVMRISPTPEQAVAWDRGVGVSALALFTFYYHFCHTYTGARRPYLILIAYGFFAASSPVILFTDLVFERMVIADYGYAPVIGPVGLALFAVVPLLIGGGILRLVWAYRASESYEARNRLLYLALAGVFPLLGTGLDGFTDLPPMAIWANLIFCTICTVAILKYHLWDIRVVARKSLSYFLVSAIIAIPYVSAIILVNAYLWKDEDPWWVYAAVLLALAIILRPLYTWVQRLVDRLFYRERYGYLAALESFSREARSLAGLPELESRLIELVGGALHASSACLLRPSQWGEGYHIVAAIGLQSPSTGAILRGDSPLVLWLIRHSTILPAGNLSVDPLLQNLSSQETQALARLGAELYVPLLTTRGDLSGIMTLGPSFRGRSYSAEDRHLLGSLSGQTAMALENARLYRDALKARDNLEMWLDSMTDCVIIVDRDQTIRFLNRVGRERFGTRVGQRSFLADRGQPPEAQAMRHEETIFDREYEIAGAPLLNPEGSLSQVYVLRDITERKRTEEQIKASLKEKEVLLQEIHHRVRNNMQVVSSLLKLQAGKLKNEKVNQAFKESQSRVSAMALVHETLYKSDSLAEIELQKHIPAVVNSAYRTLRTRQKIDIQMDMEEIKLSIDQATPLSLVINELISNSLKHAFPEGKGEITVKVRSKGEEEIEVVLSDNGPGITDDIDFDKTLGLQLVKGLVEDQLGGHWNIKREGGTKHTIRFKKKKLTGPSGRLNIQPVKH